jgi:hypothetical protein
MSWSGLKWEEDRAGKQNCINWFLRMRHYRQTDDVCVSRRGHRSSMRESERMRCISVQSRVCEVAFHTGAQNRVKMAADSTQVANMSHSAHRLHKTATNVGENKTAVEGACLNGAKGSKLLYSNLYKCLPVCSFHWPSCPFTTCTWMKTPNSNTTVSKP